MGLAEGSTLEDVVASIAKDVGGEDMLVTEEQLQESLAKVGITDPYSIIICTNIAMENGNLVVKPEMTNQPQPPEKGFTGRDTLGRKWFKGRLLAEKWTSPVIPEYRGLKFIEGRKLNLKELLGTEEFPKLDDETVEDLRYLGIELGKVIDENLVIEPMLGPQTKRKVDKLRKEGWLVPTNKNRRGDSVDPENSVHRLSKKGILAVAFPKGVPQEVSDPKTLSDVRQVATLFTLSDEGTRYKIAGHYNFKSDDYRVEKMENGWVINHPLYGKTSKYRYYDEKQAEKEAIELNRKALESNIKYLDYKGFSKKINEIAHQYHNQDHVAERLRKNKDLIGKLNNLTNISDESRKYHDLSEVDLKKRQEMNSTIQDLKSSFLYGKYSKAKKVDKIAAQNQIDKLQTELDQLNKVRDGYRDKRDKAWAEVRKKVRDEISVDNYTKINRTKNDPNIKEETLKLVDDGINWLTGIVAKGNNQEELPGFSVTNDLEDTIGRGTGGSAYYQPETHSINVTGSPEEGVRVHIHEMSHGIEYKIPGVQEAAIAFLNYRVKDEPFSKLKEVIPYGGKYYGDWEEGRKDDFDKAFGDSGWYAGKKLSGGEGTEIVSMGVQNIYEDPIGFAKKDPEYCAFILGVLDGSLRDNPIPEE